MTAASAPTRAHAVGETQGAPSSPPPAVPLVQQSKIKRLWARICSFTETTMLWMSAVGSLLMLLYQLLYTWQLLPTFYLPEPGAPAWLLGIIMLVGYIISKVPHLFGQEPGDVHGLVRELVLNQTNFTVAVVFLVSAYFGVNRAPNAVGITVMLIILFLGMMVAQAIQAIVLSRRTWTDSTGGAAAL